MTSPRSPGKRQNKLLTWSPTLSLLPSHASAALSGESVCSGRCFPWICSCWELLHGHTECVPWEPTPVAVESLSEGSLAGLVAGWPGCHGREEVICWGLSGAVTQRTWLLMPEEARAPLVEAPWKVDAGSVCLCRRCLYPHPHDTRCPSMVRSSVWARTSQAILTLPGFPRAWLLSVTTSAPGRASQVTPPANPALLPVSRQGAEPGGCWA